MGRVLFVSLFCILATSACNSLVVTPLPVAPSYVGNWQVPSLACGTSNPQTVYPISLFNGAGIDSVEFDLTETEGTFTITEGSCVLIQPFELTVTGPNAFTLTEVDPIRCVPANCTTGCGNMGTNPVVSYVANLNGHSGSLTTSSLSNLSAATGDTAPSTSNLTE